MRSTRKNFGGAHDGSVTAELALGFPAVVFLLALLMLGATTGVVQLRLESAARAGVRELARGEAVETALQAARQLAGSAVQAEVTIGNGYATVQLRSPVPGPLAALLPGPLTASATARMESPAAAAALPRDSVAAAEPPAGRDIRSRNRVPCCPAA